MSEKKEITAFFVVNGAALSHSVSMQHTFESAWELFDCCCVMDGVRETFHPVRAT